MLIPNTNIVPMLETIVVRERDNIVTIVCSLTSGPTKKIRESQLSERRQQRFSVQVEFTYGIDYFHDSSSESSDEDVFF